MKKFKCIKPIIASVAFMLIFALATFEAHAEYDIKAQDNAEEHFGAKDMPELAAHNVIVVDMDTGYTLYEKNIYEKTYPASTTKIMTAILAIENLNQDDIVTFSHDAVYSIEPGSSSGYLSEGEQLTVSQCMYGLMLVSGNDIANGLGEKVSGSMEAFAALMTKKAKELGCVNTNFVNAHGLPDDNHYTCPYDMAVISKYAYDNLELFRTFIGEEQYQVAPTPYYAETRYWYNGNKLIHDYETYYDEDCLGGKTGYTKKAGGNLVSFHNINGRIIMIIVMDDYNMTGVYVDSKVICDYFHEKLTPQFTKELDEAYKREMEGNNNETSPQDVPVGTEVYGSKATEQEINATEDNEGNTKKSSLPIGFIIAIAAALAVLIFIVHIVINLKRTRRADKKREEVF